eukprot:CAMPEP_0194554006 /NCGR_PEP_ID=MMETSP0253-20130528/97515_1 /TAXON_ID=2966 /ORGANISM="Noctiluca scintillans" /LENGTH=642 /DNA_ID=CAMNT_0039401489 /DNA_START=6 /DNA_END=1934 /DNA_ORIENTATION=-
MPTGTQGGAVKDNSAVSSSAPGSSGSTSVSGVMDSMYKKATKTAAAAGSVGKQSISSAKKMFNAVVQTPKGDGDHKSKPPKGTASATNRAVEADPAAVQHLMDMGFDFDSASAALLQVGGEDIEAAAVILANQATMESSACGAAPGDVIASAAPATSHGREAALEAAERRAAEARRKNSGTMEDWRRERGAAAAVAATKSGAIQQGAPLAPSVVRKAVVEAQEDEDEDMQRALAASMCASPEALPAVSDEVVAREAALAAAAAEDPEIVGLQLQQTQDLQLQRALAESLGCGGHASQKDEPSASSSAACSAAADESVQVSKPDSAPTAPPDDSRNADAADDAAEATQEASPEEHVASATDGAALNGLTELAAAEVSPEIPEEAEVSPSSIEADRPLQEDGVVETVLAELSEATEDKTMVEKDETTPEHAAVQEDSQDDVVVATLQEAPVVAHDDTSAVPVADTADASDDHAEARSDAVQADAQEADGVVNTAQEELGVPDDETPVVPVDDSADASDDHAEARGESSQLEEGQSETAADELSGVPAAAAGSAITETAEETHRDEVDASKAAGATEASVSKAVAAQGDAEERETAASDNPATVPVAPPAGTAVVEISNGSQEKEADAVEDSETLAETLRSVDVA